MELFFNFQAMERNGDVVAEIKNCSTPNCALIRKSFHTGKYKMCKDDIASPLFCSASDCLGKRIMMDSKDKTTGTYLSSEEKLFYNARRNDEYNMPAIESSANSSADSFMSTSSSPIWEKPPKLQSFPPKETEKLSIQDSFLNGSKLQITENSPSVENDSLPRSKSAESNLNSEITNDKLLLDYEAETSSSSIEEVYYSPGKDCQQPEVCRSPGKKCKQPEIPCSPEKRYEPSEVYYTPIKKCRLSEEYCTPEKKISQPEGKNECRTIFEIDSNHNVKIKSDGDLNENKNSSSPPSPISPTFYENDINDGITSHVKSERLMPELSPPLICLDDEDSLIPVNQKEQHEVVNVADSPQMPTLIPFTSEVDEAIRIKVESVSDNEKDEYPDSDSSDEILQPHVLLKRLPLLNHSKVSKEEKHNISSLSVAIYRKLRNEGPEIEEIEGVRFFQFRSKQEMEEFNRKPKKTEADEDMIIPTKTTDITQIKGWRTKYFAPESQFQNSSYKFEFLKNDDLNPDDKNSGDPADGQNESNDKKEADSQASDSKQVSSTPNCNTGRSGVKQQNDSTLKTEGSEENILIKDIKEEKDEMKNPMSAFISEELDQYLLNSSSLNVSLLEKVNPNIVPIPPDASILSLGKLRKIDKPFHTAYAFKRKREIFNTENISLRPVITISDSPESPNVITLGSSEESSSEEDIPVAKLKSKKRFPPRKRNLNNKGLKRKSLDNEFDQASKRLVLRLTKEGDGVSKGYKVSDISCKKDKTEPESPPSSPSSTTSSVYDEVHEPIPMPDDGSLPVIKQTLFSKKNEPHLLEEFLNNLNMYGTRKDVAMLVQSNQSYFDEGPTLNARNCAKAVSVLLSNKTFLDKKQKSKKKKLKTWQKYLPKKLSDKQKMKITLSKRKTRIQSLLNDAGDMIQDVRGKRSIRLPARYLDSAVLAASEWVSPVITLDDDSGSKRSKRQSVEAVDKNKIIDENKSKASEPHCSILSSSESSSSMPSDESRTTNMLVKPSESDLPLKKPANAKEIIKKRKKTNSSKTKQLPKEGKKSAVTLNQASVSDVSILDKNVNATVASCSKRYILPNCACKPTSRTAVFEYKSKEFFCFFCYAIQKKLFDNAASVNSPLETEKAEMNVVKKEFESSSEKDLNLNKTNISVKDLVSKSLEITNDAEQNDLIKYDTNNKFRSTTIPDENQNKCELSISSSQLASVTANSDQLLKQDKVTENVNVASCAPSNNANNKFFLLLTTVAKPVGNLNNSVPTSAHPVVPKQTEYSLKTNKKYKPPILIRKTHTGLVTPNSNNESNYLSQVESNSSCFKNTVPLRLPFSSSQDTNVATQSTSLQLTKIAENASGGCPQLTISPVTNSVDNKDSMNQNVGLVNNSVSVSNSALNSLGSSKVVTAYKVGDSFWLCNTLLPTRESSPGTITNKVVTPAFVQKQHTNGPIISSVQSVQSSSLKGENSDPEALPNGITKHAVVNYKNKLVNEMQNVSPSVCQPHKEPNAALNDHYYHKKKPQNRRKSPLSPMIYVDCENERLQLVKDKNDPDEEIDIETVDNNFIAFSETQKKDSESDSDISDDECANIFSSTTDHLASVYSKRSIQERKRRLLIKSGFENLKASSKYFKSAKSCIEILEMALCVINSLTKKEKLYTIAKERLKIHNAMLMEKLTRIVEDFEPPNTRDEIKMQVIKDLACVQQNFNSKKSVECLSEGYEGPTVNESSSERNKSSLDVLDIDLKKILLEEFTAERTSSNKGSSSEKLKQTSPNNSGDIKFEEMKEKVKASLEKKEINTDATEDLDSGENGSENSNEVITQIVESTELEKSSSKSKPISRNAENMSMRENKINKTPEKEYPGLIPLFHPKVYKENFSAVQSPMHLLNSEESSHRTEINDLKAKPDIVDVQNVSVSNQEVEDLDDDVSIIGSKIVSPVNENAVLSDSSATKDDIELTKAAQAANKFFGPCTVQKVQLKNGKTVFAYKPETANSGSYSSVCDTPGRPIVPLSTNGVRNLDNVFCAISASKSNSNQNKSSVPEEIVISDSEDETDNKNESTVSRTQSETKLNRVENMGAQRKMHAEKSDSHIESKHNDDSDSQNEELHIDESYTQNTDNTSL